MKVKPKTAVVPKWKPPVPPEIARLRWLLARGKLTDRRERERAEAQIQDYERTIGA